MSTFVYKSRKEKQTCSSCRALIPKGQFFVSESENLVGTCFKCSPFKSYIFLPSGDRALTVRSKKHSAFCGVVLAWNNKRRRYDRQGQYVEQRAILLAKEQCASDKDVRVKNNKKAEVKREAFEKEYLEAFAKAIRKEFPNCPAKREHDIALHACEKYSGRVGRSAQAKEFDQEMIHRAVEAHVRHSETDYDLRFFKGKSKKEIRTEIKPLILRLLSDWS